MKPRSPLRTSPGASAVGVNTFAGPLLAIQYQGVEAHAAAKPKTPKPPTPQPAKRGHAQNQGHLRTATPATAAASIDSAPQLATGEADHYLAADASAAPAPAAAAAVSDPPSSKSSGGLSLGWKIGLGVGGVALLFVYAKYRAVTAPLRYGGRVLRAAKNLHAAVKG